MKSKNVYLSHATLVLMFLALVSPAVQLSAQSNEVIDQILAQEQISYGHAAYLLLAADGTVAEDVRAAHTAMEERLARPLGHSAEHSLTLGEFSFITMEAFGITGGMMYTIMPHPRYAARELAFRNVIQGTAYPTMSISGERALRILGRVLTLEEEGTLR